MVSFFEADFWKGRASRLTAIDILLVGEDEEDDVTHFAVLDDTAEFRLGFFHASPVAGVNYEDESVGAY